MTKAQNSTKQEPVSLEELEIQWLQLIDEHYAGLSPVGLNGGQRRSLEILANRCGPDAAAFIADVVPVWPRVARLIGEASPTGERPRVPSIAVIVKHFDAIEGWVHRHVRVDYEPSEKSVSV